MPSDAQADTSRTSSQHDHGVDPLDAVLAQHLEAMERGEAPSVEVLAAAHPHLSEGIRAFFADRDLLDAWSGQRSQGAFPRSFGRYVLLAEVARGGMGIVYRARQETPGRIVALKMVLGGRFAAAQEIERFRLETEAVARLDHQHIVPIYEVGEHDGQPFFTMQYLAGGSLASHADRISRDPAHAARLLIKVARAVQHAHERGVLHRDLKPSNVILDVTGEPRVVDFGLAKLLEQDSAITVSGALVGTARYVAPEHARGKALATTASDVYGLGIILYELLAGRPAFCGETPLETLRLVAEVDPPQPSRWRAGVPRDLETICLKCLAKEPSRRYASAADLAKDLDRFLAGEPITARPVSRPERLWMWARRRPGTAAAIAISILATLTLAGSSVRHAGRLGDLNTRLESALGLARERAAEAEDRLRLVRNQLHALRSQEAYEAATHRDFGVANRLLRELAALGSEEDLREFEWRHLVRATEPSRSGLSPDMGAVHWVGFSSDGRSLVAIGDWNTARYIPPHFGRTDDPQLPGGLSGALTRDGSALVILNRHGAVNVFDPFTLKALVPPEGFAEGTHAIALSADGELLATGGAEGTVRIWNWRVREELKILRGSGDPVLSLALSPGADMLAAAHASGTIQLRRGRPGWEQLASVSVPEEGARALAFAPNGERLAFAGDDGIVRVWSMSPLRLEFELRDAGQPLRAIAFAPDNRTLATGGAERAVTIWDLSRRAVRQALLGHSGSISSLAFSPDGLWVASSSEDGGKHFWRAPREDDIDARGEPAVLEGHEDSVSMLAISLDNEIVTAGDDGLVSRRTLGRIEREPEETQEAVVKALAPDGSWAVIDEAGRLHLRRLFAGGEGEQAFDLGLGSFNVTVLAAFSPDSRRVAALSNGGTSFQIWRFAQDGPQSWSEEERCALAIERHRPQDRSPDLLLFSPDGRFLAYAGTMTWQIQVWDLRNRSRRFVIGSHSAATALAFSPDGRWLAAGRDKSVCIANLSPVLHDASESFQEVTLCTLAGSVSALCYSPSGRRLVTGGGDGTVLFWSLAEEDGSLTALRCARLTGHRGPVRAMQFAPGGDALCTAGGRKGMPEVLVWRTVSQEWAFR